MKVTKKIADYFLETLSDLYLFKDSQSNLYAKLEYDKHNEVYRLDTREMEDYLIDKFMQEFENTIPSDSTIKKVRRVLEMRAAKSGRKHDVYTRVANVEDIIYIDLCNEKWEVIEITKEGWKVISDTPILFTRSRIMKELPIPNIKGRIESIRPILNVKSETSYYLIIAWLLSTMKGANAYPILQIYGEQGSAKSTTTSMLRSIIDPSDLSLRTLLKDEKDIAIMTQNTFILSFDNISNLSNEMSDIMCRISSGGSFSMRTLFTTMDESYIRINRPLILNGIENLAERPDLLDRSIIIELDVIEEANRKTNEEIWTHFNKIHAEVLGALCNISSEALKEYEYVVMHEKPRMADFAKWVTAAESSLNWEQGSFLRIYNENRKTAIEQGLNQNPLALAIVNMIAAEDEVVGTFKNIFAKIKEYGDESSYMLNSISLNKLKGMLKRVSPILREYSIFMERLPRSSAGSRLRIYRK